MATDHDTRTRAGPGEPLRDEYSWHRGSDGADFRTLLKRLNQDVAQLAHDELALAKLEVREVAAAFSADLNEASRTIVLNGAKVGVALVLGWLAGLALTAGAILGLGVLLGAYWAAGLIVGAVLLIAAAVFGMSAARSLKESPELRLEHGRQTLDENKKVLADEARETKDFARDEAAAFKRHATPPEEPGHRA